MPTYTILGATGNRDPHLLSQQKLLRLLPELEGTKSSQTQIFEGSIHDIPLLTSCIRDCTVVFLIISTNDNIPGCHMAQDTAVGVIQDLKTLKTESGGANAVIPKLVLLSPATLDD
ncbi:NAD-dependent epimerase/dehydratase [Aspergillus terreus]|uniref:NAD-dependent epimerase/dehydratase n=1 Tax=Aspergillus terreus TaxID=33178 RepID=A0A5M3Z1Q4_ASPTE|nr:hypothetical protein ATETN484_0007059500 [Aspergillus terreus]GFF16562.1 NAD-dependent epimerase/dehydratase [Aspergillus terreus]